MYKLLSNTFDINVANIIYEYKTEPLDSQYVRVVRNDYKLEPIENFNILFKCACMDSDILMINKLLDNPYIDMQDGLYGACKSGNARIVQYFLYEYNVGVTLVHLETSILNYNRGIVSLVDSYYKKQNKYYVNNISYYVVTLKSYLKIGKVDMFYSIMNDIPNDIKTRIFNETNYKESLHINAAYCSSNISLNCLRKIYNEKINYIDIILGNCSSGNLVNIKKIINSVNNIFNSINQYKNTIVRNIIKSKSSNSVKVLEYFISIGLKINDNNIKFMYNSRNRDMIKFVSNIRDDIKNPHECASCNVASNGDTDMFNILLSHDIRNYNNILEGACDQGNVKFIDYALRNMSSNEINSCIDSCINRCFETVKGIISIKYLLECNIIDTRNCRSLYKKYIKNNPKKKHSDMYVKYKHLFDNVYEIYVIR